MVEDATTDIPQAEFSVPVNVTKLAMGEKIFELEVKDEERQRIAKRLLIPAVNKLNGRVDMKEVSGEIVVEGTLDAELIRQCVASLDEMTEYVEDKFNIKFSRRQPIDDSELTEEEILTSPEYLEGDILDIGEILVQQLALAMDPFPRKADAVSLTENYSVDKETSPFAVLKSHPIQQLRCEDD